MSCLSIKDTDEPLLGADGKEPGCIFCDIRAEKGFNVSFQDKDLIVIHDRSPQAETHLLIIPQHHIASVRTLRPEHLPLVKQMHALARRMHDDAIIGYHVPPFSSVSHLHLHVLAGRRTTLGRFKYPSWRKGWFVPAQQVEQALEQGKKIGLSR